MTESIFIVIIRPEFMTFCKDACRAATLNHMLYRIAGKCKDQPKEKIQAGEILWYAKTELIREEMSRAWGECKIRQEANELVDMGLIGRTKDPKWGVNRTKHFFFGEEQCAKFVELCEEHHICIVHLDVPPEVKHLIYSSNANDKSIKCTCEKLQNGLANDKSIKCISSIHQMQTMNVSDANDECIEAITKDSLTKIDNKEGYEEESITDETATSTIVPVGTARTDLHSPDYYRFLPIPVTFNEAVEYLAPHGGVPEGCYDAVEIMQLARKLWVEAHEETEQEIDDDPDKTQERMPAMPKGQNHDTSLSSPASSKLHHSGSECEGCQDGQADSLPAGFARGQTGDDRVGSAQQNHSAEHARAVVAPEASPPSTSGVPSQQMLMETPPKAKGAKKKPETPKGPPVEPPADMPWGTRKCLQWFDFWRGAYLIGTYKNSQASTCAKGLAEQYSEEQVKVARADMEAEPYYIARGGCDVCDVAANIHKYLKRRQGQMGAASRAVVLAGYTDYTSGPAIALKPMKRART